VRVVAITVALVGVAGAAPGAARPKPQRPRELAGWALYDRYCVACHGAAGNGHGPAAPYTWGQPRDFTSGEYEWRATPIGQPPTDDDLRTAIRFGAPGTSMPAFDGILATADIERVIEVIKAFAPAAFATPAGKPVALAAPPPPAATRGAELWTSAGCDRCHGARGNGDGPSAKGLTEAPYDLATDPLRRPRASDEPDARRHAAATSIATGMSGTAMPGYAGQLPDADVWALADHVVALGARAARRDRSAIDADEIAADRVAKLATGAWPGTDPDEARVFGTVIAAQGPPPASLAPAEASLSSAQCGRCHAKQLREWQTSIHARAASVGFTARMGHASIESTTCQRCHTPLAEQDSDPRLRHEGVTCAACHVRGWVRHGPPRVADSLLAIPGYPRVELALYERSDFCLPCHQLPPRTALGGKPLLNTYKEWLDGPYMRRGIQCQHCHMPNREHAWLGVHDRATFRQGIRVGARAHRSNGAVTVVAELANIGAGHYLPTTPTPAAWLVIELIDGDGATIDGARDELRIGRDLVYDGAWHERADTRIPPGESRVMARAWSQGRTAEAVAARVTVEVHPDDYYEHLYETVLAGQLGPDVRAPYEQALARARASHYIAEQQDVGIALSSP
jgi:mono/diheme cytochrome c family protein